MSKSRMTTRPRDRSEIKRNDAIRFRPEYRSNTINIVVTTAPWEMRGHWFVKGVRMNREGRQDSQSRENCWMIPEHVEEITDHPGWGV